MKKRLIAAVLITASVILSSLFCLSCEKKAIIKFLTSNEDGNSGAQENVNFEVFFKPIVEFNGEAFPVKTLSTASANSWYGAPRMVNNDNYIGDIIGDFGATIFLKGPSNERITVTVEIEGDRFIKKSKLEAVIPTNKEIEVFPRISYNYGALEHLVQPASENVYFRLIYGSDLIFEETEVVRFHSVNEVPIYELSRWDGESVIDHRLFFAAYVNEDDPLIDKILEEALHIGVAEKIGYGNYFSFSGYQRKDQYGNSGLSVDLQVLAIWSVFLNHNVKYSNITTTSTANNTILTQYVRTLGESFGNSQANCVDGSVLIASVLRKIGIEPYLIVIPGHMFLGYLKNQAPAEYAFLETTMLGDVDISKYAKDDSMFWNYFGFTGFENTQSTAIVNSFKAALAVGQKNFNEAQYGILDENNNDYIVINISNCRELGIKPIVRN